MFYYYCKLSSSGYPLAQHSIPLLSAGTTLVPPFWSGRYLARVKVLMRVTILWFIRFNGAAHWSLCWRGLGVTLSGLAFLTSPIFIIMPWCTSSKISPHHWIGPRKNVSNWTPHLLTPALLKIDTYTKTCRCHLFPTCALKSPEGVVDLFAFNPPQVITNFFHEFQKQCTRI